MRLTFVLIYGALVSAPATPASPTEPPASPRGYFDGLHAIGRSWLGTWRPAVSRRESGSDLIAGFTLAAVAMPLNLALAVASGLPPQAGLVAGAIGGGLGAVFGGSPLQVTGPAAALSTMVFAIVADFGIVGAAAAAIGVGGVQLLLGVALAGRLVKYIPESVLVGFTTGVGLKLLDNQIPELLGFDSGVAQLGQMFHRPEWLHEVSGLAVLSGLAVAFLVVALRAYQRVPAALIGVVAVTAVSSYLGWHLQRVGTIPAELGAPTVPLLPADRWVALLWRALPLGLLASVESLLSARAVDRLSGAATPHSPNLELLGQGVANVGSGLMGAMPVSGVIVRSSVNVQSGGRTRRASLVHSVALALAVLFFARPLSAIPLAALAGLLCVVGFRLVEVSVLFRLWKEHKLGALAFVVTAAGTVSGHLMLGLVAGLCVGGLGIWLQGPDDSEGRSK